MNIEAHYGTHGDEVDQLIDAAREYWGDSGWAIRQTLWDDGDSDAYAYKSHGRDGEGFLIEERLYPTNDGVRGERKRFEKQEVDSEDLGFVGKK